MSKSTKIITAVVIILSVILGYSVVSQPKDISEMTVQEFKSANDLTESFESSNPCIYMDSLYYGTTTEDTIKYERSLQHLLGCPYHVYRIHKYVGYQVVDEQIFFNTAILTHFLRDYGKYNSPLSDNPGIRLGSQSLTKYLAAWGQTQPLRLDTIWLDWWNSHGNFSTSPHYQPNDENFETFIDMGSTAWDEIQGVPSSPLPHNSITLLLPTGTSGTYTIIHLVNQTPQPRIGL